MINVCAKNKVTKSKEIYCDGFDGELGGGIQRVERIHS